MINQDALLVAGVKAGDEDAFTAVVERYQVAIDRYLLRLVGDSALAEELCQETFFAPIGLLSRPAMSWR